MEGPLINRRRSTRLLYIAHRGIATSIALESTSTSLCLGDVDMARRPNSDMFAVAVTAGVVIGDSLA